MNVKTPKNIAEITSIHLRPKRSASMPSTIAPSIGPNIPAESARPKAPGFTPRDSAIFGSVTPIIVRSKPSRNVTRKHRKQTMVW